MDTTIRNLDEEAYRRIKARAALEGRTLGEAVSEAIRRYVEPGAAASAGPGPERRRPAGEVAEAGDPADYGEGAAAEPPGALPPVGPPTLAACLERLAELGRPDAGFAEDLEAIQAAQPRIPPGAWDS